MTDALTIVPAGAGSGKTHRIKTTLTRWVRDKAVRPERILAVTFTEAAAGELRERIRASLLAEGLVHEALDVERAYVSTIHALGLRILGEHAFAAEVSPKSRLLSDPERDLLVRRELAHGKAFATIRADLPRFGYEARPGKSWTSAEDAFRKDVVATIDLLRGLGEEGLNPALAEAAESDLRKAYGSVRNDSDVIEARLRDAVAALLDRFPEACSNVTASDSAMKTFRKDCACLRAALEEGRLGRDWKLWNSLRDLRLSRRGSPTPEGYDALAQEVMDAAEGILDHPGPLDDACACLRALVTGAQDVLRRYGVRKREAGLIDFADMIVDTERVLRERPDVLDAMLSEVDCVVVDEFQDTNPIQFALLWRLAARARRTLLVGDVKQSIMGFQGADPRLSAALAARFPDRLDPLGSNWRSDPRIMAFVNALGTRLFGAGYDALAPVREATGETCLEVLRLANGRGARTKSKPPEHVAARIAALLAENTLVVDRHTREKRPVRPGDIAVLCQTHSHAASYAAALRAWGVPVRIAEEGWLASRAVSVARAALAFAADPSDLHAALCLLTLGPAALPIEDALAALADGRLLEAPALAPLAALAPEAAVMSVEGLVPRVLTAAGLAEWALALPDPLQRRADLIRLEHEAAEFACIDRETRAAAGFHGATAQVFLAWLAARTKERDFDCHPDPSAGAPEGVEIVTWHASKGREWNIVVVTGLDSGLHTRPGTLEAAFEDLSDLDRVLSNVRLIWTPRLATKEKQELFITRRREAARETARRLIYVAKTRARDRLVLEWPDHCFKNGEPKDIATFAALLHEQGIGFAEGALTLGAEAFPAHVIRCPDLAPDPTPVTVDGQGRAATRFGEPRAPAPVSTTPWRRRPSALAGGPFAAEPETIDLGIPVRAAANAAGLDAAERGTAWHLAFRTLLARPDRADRLEPATGLDQETLSAIAAQARALRAWLAEHGFTELHHEVPVQVVEPSGAQTNGVVDLLARGPAGLAVIDLKSGAPRDRSTRFASYLPQLEAYAEALGHVFPVPPRLLAILWMSEGLLSVTPHGEGRAATDSTHDSTPHGSLKVSTVSHE